MTVQWYRTAFTGTGGKDGIFIFPIAFVSYYSCLGYAEGYGSYIVDQGIIAERTLTQCKWALYAPAANNWSANYNVLVIGV